ncbi:MAG: DUF503 domain-containing protein [Firmicutes bacterium]|jgi:uncharacterized protein YlxP (DUF503 family)|nr:DUF503 domain-containing protein [Bacillota bacterium]
MVVSVMTVKLYAPWVQSLKEKRMIAQSLCQKLRNKFNVSVIESDAQDVQQTIIISIAFLTDSSAKADQISDKITRFIEGNVDAEIVDLAVEKV